MKIFLMSDLHLEFPGSFIPEIPSAADVVILAGDIAPRSGASSCIEELYKIHPGKTFLFVAGNHEYYDSHFERVQKFYTRSFADIENVHYLERNSIVINNVLFLGCTLWTGFDAYPNQPPSSILNGIQNNITDFRVIVSGEDNNALTPEFVASQYHASRRWLENELSSNEYESKVVITHFPPCPEVGHGCIPIDDLTPYFQANCKDLIYKYKPDLWLFGHNHYNHDKIIDTTRVVSNQRGYPGEIDSFRPDLIINMDRKV
jgi:predicted phosphohydrolase